MLFGGGKQEMDGCDYLSKLLARGFGDSRLERPSAVAAKTNQPRSVCGVVGACPRDEETSDSDLMLYPCFGIEWLLLCLFSISKSIKLVC